MPRLSNRWIPAIGIFFAIALLTAGRAEPAPPDLSLDQYRGKVVVVDFWASWCVPCRRSFPWLNEMQRRYGEDGLVVLGVNVDSDPADAQQFLEDFPANFTIVPDPDGALAAQYDVIAMPSSYVIGRDGRVVARHLGFKTKKSDDYEAVITAALAHEVN